MDLDHLLFDFFGTDQPARLSRAEFSAGAERLLVQLGLEQDAGRRFALWCLAYMLDVAPDIGAVFDSATDGDAARDFMDAIDAAPTE